MASSGGGLGVDGVRRGGRSRRRRWRLGVHLLHAAGEDDAEAGAQLVAQGAVALGLGGLALERRPSAW